jgi:hypothetical protein
MNIIEIIESLVNEGSQSITDSEVMVVLLEEGVDIK